MGHELTMGETTSGAGKTVLIDDLLPKYNVMARAMELQSRPRKDHCSRCGSTEGVKMEPSRTMYHWEGKWDDPKNPNAERPYCRPCAEEHHAYWDDMWAEYNSGRL